MRVGLLGGDAPPRERRDDRLLRLGGGQARVLAGLLVHQPVLADHRDLLEAVRAADLEVVGVVARRDLQRAGAELGVDVGVGDDRQAPADQRQDACPPTRSRVALVVGVDGDGGVGEHRLRPDRGDREHAVAALDRVVDRVEDVGDVAVLDLEVADRRVRARVPVDHVVVAVDQALLEERDEDAVDGADVALVEGEALVGVVAGGAEPLELLDDLRAVLLAPLPDALDERLAAELVAVDPSARSSFSTTVCVRDAGVVGAEDPLRVAPPSGAGGSARPGSCC